MSVEGQIMDLGVTGWATIAAGLITTVGGVVIARLAGRQNRQVAETAARGPDWKAFTDSLQRQVDIEREAREATDERLAETMAKLTRTDRALRDIRGRYVAAVRHIKEWRVWVVTREGVPPHLPDELTIDVDDPPVGDE